MRLLPIGTSYRALRLQRAYTAVENEYEENDRRLNWSLIFHAFLFQAYVICLQTLSNNSDNSGISSSQILLMLFVICIVGTLTALITLISTRSAIKALESAKEIRQKISQEALKKYGIEIFGYSVTDKLHNKGLLPTRAFPWILLVAWLVAVYLSLCLTQCLSLV